MLQNEAAVQRDPKLAFQVTSKVEQHKRIASNQAAETLGMRGRTVKELALQMLFAPIAHVSACTNQCFWEAADCGSSE
jgi:hypothetical protein